MKQLNPPRKSHRDTQFHFQAHTLPLTAFLTQDSYLSHAFLQGYLWSTNSNLYSILHLLLKIGSLSPEYHEVRARSFHFVWEHELDQSPKYSLGLKVRQMLALGSSTSSASSYVISF